MTKKEMNFVKPILEKIRKYRIKVDISKLMKYASGELIEVMYNDNKLEIVDRNIEYLLCKLSPLYFIDNYGWIRHPKKGVIPFKMFYFQKFMIDEIIDKEKLVIFKDRQLGISTITACVAVWLSNFYSGQFIEIISISERKAQEFKRKCDTFYRRIPSFLRTPLKPGTKGSKSQLDLINESQILSETSGENPARGDSVSFFVIDEAAFIKTIEDAWAAILPAAEQGRILIISTPNGNVGTGEWFYNKWKQCKAGELEGFTPLEFYWWEFLGRDNKWIEDMQEIDYRRDKDLMNKCKRRGEQEIESRKNKWLERQRSNLGEMKFRQEILHEFVISGDTVFDTKKVEELKKGLINPITVDRLGGSGIGGFWMWREVMENRKYIAGCLAEGEKIVCKDGIKKIEEVKVGDEVWGESGWVKVIGTSKRWINEEKLLYMKMKGVGEGIIITQEHPIKIEKEGFLLSKDVGKEDRVFYKFRKGIGKVNFKENGYFAAFMFFDRKREVIKDTGDSLIIEFNVKFNDFERFLEKVDNVEVVYSGRFHRDAAIVRKKVKKNDLLWIKNLKEGKFEWIFGMDEQWKKDFLNNLIRRYGFIRRDRGVLVLRFSNINMFKIVHELLLYYDIQFSVTTNEQWGKETMEIGLMKNSTLKVLELIDHDFEKEKIWVDKTVGENKHKYTERKDDGIILKINKIGLIDDYKGYVYNLETSDSTYYCDHFLLHNCDVGKGDARDHSTIQVFDAGSMEQVAEYKGKIRTDKFGKVIKKICGYYNNAYCVIESTGIGQGVFDDVYGDEKNPYLNVMKFRDVKGKTHHTGWQTTNKNRGLLLNAGFNSIMNNEIFIKSERLWEEIRTLIWKNGRMDHSNKGHDDLFFAMCLCVYNRDHMFGYADSFMYIGDEIVEIKDNEKDEESGETLNLLAEEDRSIKDNIEKQYGISWELYQSLFKKKK